MNDSWGPRVRRLADLNNEEQDQYVRVIKRIVGGLREEPDGASKILDHLYLGSQEDAMNIEKLKQMEITHIVNAVEGTYLSKTSRKFYGDDFKYLGFMSNDTLNYPIMKHFDDTYKFIEDARTTGGKCLIHCISGINRSGALTVAYVMVHKNMGPVSATRLVHAAREGILSNKGFIVKLVQFADDKGILTLDAHEVATS